MTERQTRATAYHEAGHAVACVVLGLKFSWILLASTHPITRKMRPVRDRRFKDGWRRREQEFSGLTTDTGGGLLAIVRRVNEGKPIRPQDLLRVQRQIVQVCAGPAAEE